MSVALLAPHVNTATFNVFPVMLAEELGPKGHAVPIMDQAGWHKSKEAQAAPEHLGAVPAAVLPRT